MSKEYIQALDDLFGLVAFQEIFTKAQKYFDIIEEALHRLESIDNANPSEALEILEEISKEEVLFKSRNTIYMGGEKSNSFTHKDTIGNYFKGIDNIKQALLKAQEPKQYLKWEDLEFPYGVWKNAKVVLNGKELGIRYKSDYGFMDCDYKVVKIFNLETGKCICKIYDKDKDFFDNLHLQFKKECSNCKKQHTNDCPNSSECYSKKDKPYWDRVEE